MKEELFKRVEEIKSKYIILVEGTSVPRSHPIHNAGGRAMPSSATKFHELLEIRKDMDFDKMDKSVQFLAHGLLHFLFYRVKNGRRVVGDLNEEDIKKLHKELIDRGDIPHSKFDGLD